MWTLTVGQPYDAEIIDGVSHTALLLHPEGSMLTIFFADPTPGEVAAVNTGEARFAWIDATSQGLLLSRFGAGIPWQESPYAPQRASDGWFLPDMKPGEHRPVSVVLVDITTGLIAALRITTWNHFFVTAVRKSLTGLTDIPYDDDLAMDQLHDLMRRYPLVNGADNARVYDRMIRERALATCRGGATNEELGLAK